MMRRAQAKERKGGLDGLMGALEGLLALFVCLFVFIWVSLPHRLQGRLGEGSN
jgi:hypothetical protein